jgi:hypothetical protein
MNGLRPLGDEAPGPAQTAWERRSIAFEVPAGCDTQWLRLLPHPGERRADVTAFYRKIAITPLSAGPPAR